MTKQRLHTIPFITAGVFLLAGIALMMIGLMMADGQDMNGYAIGAFGLLFVITAAVTFAMYSNLEKRYRDLLREEPLLRYTLNAEAQQAQIKKNMAELKAKNKALLMVMLFFCALSAIILPFFVEEKIIMIFICLGLGAFLAMAAWVITAYRLSKLQRGGKEVILGRGGVYLDGSFHAWNMPGTDITALHYKSPASTGMLGQLKIEYTAQAIPAPLKETIILLIPNEMEGKVPGVLQALEETRGP